MTDQFLRSHNVMRLLLPTDHAESLKSVSIYRLNVHTFMRTSLYTISMLK